MSNEGLKTEEELRAEVEAFREAAMARIRSLSVSDALDQMARKYDDLVRSGNPQMATGAEYLAERCRATSDTFRDAKRPERCVLEGRASAVDFLRGFRVLAEAHPNGDARELYAALGNQLANVLSDRAGMHVDVAPEFVEPSQIGSTLLAWHELTVRASQLARRDSVGHSQTKGGISLIGRSAEMRVRLGKELIVQSMAELGVLISAINGTEEEASDADASS